MDYPAASGQGIKQKIFSPQVAGHSTHYGIKADCFPFVIFVPCVSNLILLLYKDFIANNSTGPFSSLRCQPRYAVENRPESRAEGIII